MWSRLGTGPAELPVKFGRNSDRAPATIYHAISSPGSIPPVAPDGKRVVAGDLPDGATRNSPDWLKKHHVDPSFLKIPESCPDFRCCG